MSGDAQQLFFGHDLYTGLDAASRYKMLPPPVRLEDGSELVATAARIELAQRTRRESRRAMLAMALRIPHCPDPEGYNSTAQFSRVSRGPHVASPGLGPLQRYSYSWPATSSRRRFVSDSAWACSCDLGRPHLTAGPGQTGLGLL